MDRLTVFMSLFFIFGGIAILTFAIYVSENVAGSKWRWRMSRPDEMFAMMSCGLFVLSGLGLLISEWIYS